MESGTERIGYVGRSIRRLGDERLLRGAGRFVDDVRIAGTLHVAFARGPVAHGVIRWIDATAAARVPGVVGVFTGEEVAGWVEPVGGGADLLPGRELRRYPLAVARVRFVGDAVAAVVADDPAVARDAADRIEVAYDELPVVVDAEAALAADAPLVYPGWGSNLAFRWQVEAGDVEDAFARAERIVSIRVVNQRVYAAFLEPRGVLANPEPGGDLTVWASTQGPHGLRTAIAGSLRVPEHRLRVIAPDVGGAFGSKGGTYPEYLLIPALAMRLGRPVKWIESRTESLLATSHGRDQVQRLRAAVAADGEILGVDIEIVANLGAYNAAMTGRMTGLMSAGPYRFRNLRTTVLGAMTNVTPLGSYRGAGRPEGAYMLERLIEAVARELELDSAAVRRRNFIPPAAFPYQSPTGAIYDSGDYDTTLTEALSRLDYDAFRMELAEARRAGRLVGVGIGVYCEYAGPGWDTATVRVSPSGAVTVTSGTSPHGQGQETSLAQVVADQLGVTPDDVAVRTGDTALTPQGLGTFGSRGTSVGGSAILLAAREVHQKARRIAAHLLEAADEDVVFANGRVEVRGVPNRGIAFADIARAAHAFNGPPGGEEPGLEATRTFLPSNRTTPYGVHLAVVEVDRETGEVALQRYLAVDDCGPLINPQLVEGQVVGGLAQGVGQALYEAIVFDGAGQPLTGSFLDYAVPRATQLPTFETAHTVTPSPFNPLGVKGVGEAGTTGAPPAVVNAVLDALTPLGVRHLDMPLTPERVWRAMNEALGVRR
ncbi:MAG: xanthine dehydrogenase family protein molybdopterin-binding subunit [Thermomicrobiales bacterium]